MRSSFEEKTYENYFNNELDKCTKIYFPLGQVQEGSLGFDSSAYSYNHRLWEILGYPYFIPFKGCELKEIASIMEEYLEIVIDKIPKMKANLLFQYKKPEYINSHLGKEWDKWNQPYYRYDIYKEQQDLLMRIHLTLGDKVLVIYASPALHKVDDLVDAHISRKIIDYSNFRKAEELKSHHRNTYIKAGTHSIACSDTEEIKNFNLLELLEEKFPTRNEVNYNFSNREFIIDFKDKIISIVSENHYFSNSFNKLNSLILEVKHYELFYSILIMMNFKQLIGTQWLIKI